MADYNIALGVKQPEPVNYLGQAAQMMALRAAQDELQGNEAVKQFYAQGGDLSTPEARARLKSINPKFGMAAEKAQLEAQKTQAEVTKSHTGFIGAAMGFLKDAPTLENAYAILDDLGQKGALTPQAVAAAKQQAAADPSQIGAHATRLWKQAIDADKQMTDETTRFTNAETNRTRIQAANISAGPGYAQARNAAERLAFEKAKGHVVAGDNGFINFDVYGNPRQVPGYGTYFGPDAQVDGQSAAVLANNALLGGGGAAPSIDLNNLNPSAQTQTPATGPTVAAARQLAQTQNVPRPPARVGYRYNAQGQQEKIPQVGVPEGVRLGVDERWNDETKQVELVPGSKTYLATQNKQGADREAARKVAEATSWGSDRINRILAPENTAGRENQFGGYSAYLTRLFTGNTAKVGAELDSLKSDMKNAGLQVIRAGGSIGAMTEKEWPIVEGLIDSLNPKMNVKDAEEVLQRIDAKLQGIASTAAQTYEDKWGGTQFHKPLPSTDNAGGGRGANVVTTPDGVSHTFPNAKAAAAFKKAAGL